MEPERLRFGGGAAETILHPLVAVWMMIAILLILIVPRRVAIVPFLLAIFSIPVGQVIVLGGLHFTVLRVLILSALVRGATFGGGRWFPGRFNTIDRVVMLWTVSALVVISLQWMNAQMLIRSLGDFLDALGGYLAVRFLISNRGAIRRTVKTFAVICAIQGACMINEQISHINIFGLLGGIPLQVTIRDGNIRSQGVLGYANAGVFGSVLIPLFVWLWMTRKSRVIAAVGFAGATVMAFTTSASTSAMTYCASLMGLCFWPLRKRMRVLVWGFALALVGLHLIMKAPVWALIARVDLTGSSSSYHRYYLLDNCIRHFGDWWLLGYTHYNDWGWDMWDTCNQFVDVALKGGLVTLVLYLAIFNRSFAALGMARKRVGGNRGKDWLLWCLGSALFATVVAHFGINYMAQLMLNLFPLLACISVATFEASHGAVRKVESPPQVPSEFAPAAEEDLSSVLHSATLS